jgi:hypothetical protein
MVARTPREHAIPRRDIRLFLVAGVLLAALGWLHWSAVPGLAHEDVPVPPPPMAGAKVLQLTPAKATVGERVTLVAEGLPANSTVDLVWETVNGDWVIQDYYYFRGKKFAQTAWSLGHLQVGNDGRLEGSFQVPEDYGGAHNVVATIGDSTVAQGLLDVTQSFEMTPREGPVGTLIEVSAKGIGWQTMESTWVLNWDNHEVGWLSAVSSRGSATARFRATGPEGKHVIKVYSGYMGQSYLNFEQAPTAYLPRPEFTFLTTPGAAAPEAYIEPYAKQPLPPSESVFGAKLDVFPTQGPVLTQARLTGAGLPPTSELSLRWHTMVGSRVTSAGFEPRVKELFNVRVAADGSVDVPLTIPDDLGGLHALTLHNGDLEVARSYFAVETSIVSISPTSGPVGTPISIHLKGVGWTEYDNIYVVNYDNAYMGYACGFNSQGDVVINFMASGAPGVHLIDLYPGLYQGPEKGQQLYRLPQLTYADDHPGNRIPALRFSFTVTE